MVTKHTLQQLRTTIGFKIVFDRTTRIGNLVNAGSNTYFCQGYHAPTDSIYVRRKTGIIPSLVYYTIPIDDMVYAGMVVEETQPSLQHNDNQLTT